MNSAVSCEKCAAEIAEDSQFCRKCGYGFGTVADDQVPNHPVRISPISRRAYTFLLAIFNK